MSKEIKNPIRISRWNGFLKSIRRNDEITFEEVGNVIQEKMRVIGKR